MKTQLKEKKMVTQISRRGFTPVNNQKGRRFGVGPVGDVLETPEFIEERLRVIQMAYVEREPGVLFDDVGYQLLAWVRFDATPLMAEAATTAYAVSRVIRYGSVPPGSMTGGNFMTKLSSLVAKVPGGTWLAKTLGLISSRAAFAVKVGFVYLLAEMLEMLIKFSANHATLQNTVELDIDLLEAYQPAGYEQMVNWLNGLLPFSNKFFRWIENYFNGKPVMTNEVLGSISDQIRNKSVDSAFELIAMAIEAGTTEQTSTAVAAAAKSSSKESKPTDSRPAYKEAADSLIDKGAGALGEALDKATGGSAGDAVSGVVGAIGKGII